MKSQESINTLLDHMAIGQTEFARSKSGSIGVLHQWNGEAKIPMGSVD